MIQVFLCHVPPTSWNSINLLVYIKLLCLVAIISFYGKHAAFQADAFNESKPFNWNRCDRFVSWNILRFWKIFFTQLVCREYSFGTHTSPKWNECVLVSEKVPCVHIYIFIFIHIWHIIEETHHWLCPNQRWLERCPKARLPVSLEYQTCCCFGDFRKILAMSEEVPSVHRWGDFCCFASEPKFQMWDQYPMTDPCMLYMVTFTINIPQMLAYIYHTWILWVWINNWLRSDWIKLDQRWNLWNLGPRQERNRYGRYSRWCVRHFWSQVVVGKTPMVWMHCCLK